jgi:hypothetical protein
MKTPIALLTFPEPAGPITTHPKPEDIFYLSCILKYKRKRNKA